MTSVTNLSDFQALAPFFRIIEEALAGLTWPETNQRDGCPR